MRSCTHLTFCILPKATVHLSVIAVTLGLSLQTKTTGGAMQHTQPRQSNSTHTTYATHCPESRPNLTTQFSATLYNQCNSMQESLYAIMCQQKLFEFFTRPMQHYHCCSKSVQHDQGTPEKPMYNTIKRLIIILRCHQWMWTRCFEIQHLVY